MQQQGTCTQSFLGTQPRAGRRPCPAAITTYAIALSHHRRLRLRVTFQALLPQKF